MARDEGSPGYQVLKVSSGLDHEARWQAFADEVLVGLTSKPKRLSSKFFYDDEGSRLFRRIMALDAYYPTRCERSIFSSQKDELLGPVGGPVDVVDLGAGDGTKTRILLESLHERGVDVAYVPIDISEAAMASLVREHRNRCPDIPIDGLVAEYAAGLRWLSRHRSQRKRLVLCLGSNLGNFDPPHARAFLRRLWGSLAEGDHVLLGFDLKKDIDVLLRAYNDSEGVTAAFNLNLLHRINRELAGHFDPERFRHFGTYDVFSGAMVSYLVSVEAHQVWVEGLETHFAFDAFEPIHTEYSYKFLRGDVTSMAADTGYRIEGSFEDAQGWFLSSLWRVQKRAK